MRLWLLALLCLTTAATAQGRSLPLVTAAGELELVALPGVRVEQAPAEGPGGAALALTIHKASTERRLVALRAVPTESIDWAQSLAVNYRCDPAIAAAARLAVLLHEPDGDVWYRVAGDPLEPGDWREARVPLTSLQLAAFSDGDRKQDLTALEQVWFGAVIDGAVRGELALAPPAFSSEPYRPTQPLQVPLGAAGDWTVGKDPAASGTVTMPAEGPAGESVMRFDFELPGGRHMYALPSRGLGDVETEGYRTLRIRYQAQLPPGPHLLFSLAEPDGSQYLIDPPPAPAAEWTVLEWPLDQLKLGGWTKDENDRFDLGRNLRITVGVHGTTKDDGDGTIWIAEIALLP